MILISLFQVLSQKILINDLELCHTIFSSWKVCNFTKRFNND
jgi:hypothetical protein